MMSPTTKVPEEKANIQKKSFFALVETFILDIDVSEYLKKIHHQLPP